MAAGQANLVKEKNTLSNNLVYVYVEWESRVNCVTLFVDLYQNTI